MKIDDFFVSLNAKVSNNESDTVAASYTTSTSESDNGVNVVFTVGNELRGDDAAGPSLAELLERKPVTGWEVVDGSSVPENHVHAVRRLKPTRVLVVDAAEMGLMPGDVRRLSQELVASQFLMTTHSLPLSFLLESLKESVTEVEFLGIQPKDTSFLAPMCSEVAGAVTFIYDWLNSGANIEYFGYVDQVK
ncbi:MAG: hydrogenase maturation peptidase HycI [Coriobacteriales bacterium]|jgi:hydrogenase 3 maturation protease|nr:hydrogenase maturation peptidase HycI [Coriobacteriales bacterium]